MYVNKYKITVGCVNLFRHLIKDESTAPLKNGCDGYAQTNRLIIRTWVLEEKKGTSFQFLAIAK
jgi:hypothetical protein